MSDRADYLSRTLIARLANLHASLAEDGRAAPDRRQRLATIEKLFAVELGLTDGTILSTIESAAPHFVGGARPPEREQIAFAAFLRERLGARLDEP